MKLSGVLKTIIQKASPTIKTVRIVNMFIYNRATTEIILQK
jgi:hypothetical protein